MVPETCSFPDCNGPLKVKGLKLCGGHYMQHSKGKTLTPIVKYSKTCTFDGCGIKSSGLGLCKKHYQRKYQGRPLEDPVLAKELPCSIEGCDSLAHCRGWCELHYARWQRQGDPEKTMVILGDDTKRFLSKVDSSGDCHIWMGTMGNFGYGAFRVKGKTVRAHRFAFEIKRGTIPKGIVLDHICHNRACVKVEHLRFATDKQNGENRGDLNSNNKSGVRGVSWRDDLKKWDARVMHNREYHLAGTFERIEDAAEAVRLLRNKLFTYNDSDRTQK
ncbi:HNH endonuclease [Arthrobacter phage 1191A]|nr:HNH endonuclease [Arthrobacter phage 1191A]